MTESCATCRFWKPFTREDGMFERGQCRRHAPQAANQATLFLGEAVIGITDILSRHFSLSWPTDIEAEPTETTNTAMFPRTYDDDWCGEFEPRCAA
jgi:hypothetical protein